MTTRAQIMEKIASLPDTVNWDTVMYNLKLQESLIRADEDIAAGRVYSGDAARQRVRELAREKHGSNLDR
ncbi:hypothetical protein FACS1894191_2980 [Clostridia bacterium]|nr:hypothetical protein FACS1894191_2980 [Clostridia bacterium]